MRLAMRKGKEGKGSDGSNTWGREMGKYVKGKSAALTQWCPSIGLANKTISNIPELVFFSFLFFYVLTVDSGFGTEDCVAVSSSRKRKKNL